VPAGAFPLATGKRPATLPGAMETLRHTTDVWEAAVAYARLGLPIIPLRGKVPAVREWQRFFATEFNLRVWFGARRCNIGLRTGESGYVVIDTDTPEAEAWARARCATTPLVARSGGGSTHRYYRTPPRAEIRNRQGLHRIPGLDVRGQGGFIVLPPSVHPATGRRYEWKASFRPAEGLPRFSPSWVYERVRRRVRAVVCDEPSALLRRAQAYLARVEPAVSGQGGHNRQAGSHPDRPRRPGRRHPGVPPGASPAALCVALAAASFRWSMRPDSLL
jgi:hypothetical protein